MRMLIKGGVKIRLLKVATMQNGINLEGVVMAVYGSNRAK